MPAKLSMFLIMFPVMTITACVAGVKTYRWTKGLKNGGNNLQQVKDERFILMWTAAAAGILSLALVDRMG